MDAVYDAPRSTGLRSDPFAPVLLTLMGVIRRRLTLCAPAIAVLVLLPATGASALQQATLISKLRTYTAKLGPSSGAYVADITAGVELFALRPTTPRIPASNEKLFTTATALQAFGPAATLNTTVVAAPGAVLDAGGVLHGDLYLVGAGDPTLGDNALRSLVRQIHATGAIKRFTGSVIGDESIFDAKRGSQASNFTTDSDLEGSLGGLTWNHGRASPGGPAAVAARRLQALLKSAGITAGHKARRGTLHNATGGAAPALATVASPPMSELIAETNQPSDNFYAETLLKDLGARFGGAGSTAAGLTVVRKELRGIGIDATVLDGSGLSHSDRTTPHEIVTLLRSMAAGPQVNFFIDSLAAPGSSGTLAKRMRGTAAVGRCHAKTGTLSYVSALSGYCRTTGGHLLAFSFMENNVSPTAAKKIEDKMVPALAAYAPTTNAAPARTVKHR